MVVNIYIYSREMGNPTVDSRQGMRAFQILSRKIPCVRRHCSSPLDAPVASTWVILYKNCSWSSHVCFICITPQCILSLPLVLAIRWVSHRPDFRVRTKELALFTPNSDFFRKATKSWYWGSKFARMAFISHVKYFFTSASSVFNNSA